MDSAESPVALVVEDDDQVRNFVTAVLQREGFHVLTARNASEALIVCRRQRNVTVLLTDGQMGSGLTGIELAAILLKEQPELSALLISGTPEIGLLAAERKLEFLEKPFMIRDLLDRLYRVMGPKVPVQSHRDRRKKMTG